MNFHTTNDSNCIFHVKASASAEDVKLMKSFGVRGEFKVNFNDPEVERVRR